MPEAIPTHRSSIKETITQLVIAFVMAFVFRGFVIEAFLIPTGSMAPTLMGAHMRFTGKDSGYQWSVAPWQLIPGGTSGEARPLQGEQLDPIVVNDPMTGAESRQINVPLMGGDRIFVLKYLYSIFDPQRFDCVVFKNPTNPDENYIKRLIGLPNEQVALIHGDVFVRPASASSVNPAVAADWASPGWHIARKPDRVQRALWMPVFSSEFAPVSPTSPAYWESPWIGSPAFEVGRASAYRASGAATLRWNDAVHPIEDFYPYNQVRGYTGAKYLVPDIRLRAGVCLDAPGVVVSATVESCGHEFRADIDATTITLRRREVPTADGQGAASVAGEPSPWQTLATATLPRALPQGGFADVEFWHVDQSMQVWIDGRRVAYAEYDWTPRERVLHATGRTLDQLLENEDAFRDRLAQSMAAGGEFQIRLAEHRRASNILVERDEYRPSKARWEFTGPVTLERVGLDRDIYYQPGIYYVGDAGRRHSHYGQPARATHPEQPCLLGPHQFFVCGDNSAASLDARLWDAPAPWIADLIDPTLGVVPRDLLIGKAFFVYFPALHRERPVPVPDFGRMRFIW